MTSFGKFFDNAIQFVKVFVAVISATATVLYFGTGYIKTEIQSAVLGIIKYEVEPLKIIVKENKEKIDKIDKEMPLVTYRLTALENISKYAILPTEVKAPRKKDNS